MEGFPSDDYTPYGYLDVHGHTTRLSPKGVMRFEDVGFAWHFPALARRYGGRVQRYVAGLSVADVEPVEVRAPYHSSRLCRFVLPTDPVCTTSWLMTDDDVLAVRLVAHSATTVPVRARYRRMLEANGSWGESGLVCAVRGGVLLLQGFEDGDAFAIAVMDAEGLIAMPEKTSQPVIGERGLTVSVTQRFDVGVGPAPTWVIMSRGVSVDEAVRRLPAGVQPVNAALRHTEFVDDLFWSQAPVLSGDWPATWRRGPVYDLETLRMMVKEPIGVYQHHWDAMQIQSPRVVLAEAAMDALTLSWADPDAARDLLLGTFADAPRTNVPCTREDGSYNMVAADGTVCGTGPEWGLPYLVAERLAVGSSQEWRSELYQLLAGHLDWWLRHRVDSEGWLVHACSWESGQDLSPRFGEQPLGGGHPNWSLRPVDLHAAAAHAAGVLERMAPTQSEAARWQGICEHLTGRTRRLWREGDARFIDVEGRTGLATSVVDPMQLLPVSLGVATAGQMRRQVQHLSGWSSDSMIWPMTAWVVILAAERTGRWGVAARWAADVVDRAYRHWDRRTPTARSTLPGTACEYWPLGDDWGGEGYGWGAFTLELLLSHVLGLRVTQAGVVLRPLLPEPLRCPGNRYRLDITLPNGRRTITIEPGEEDVRVLGLGASARLRWGRPVGRSWSQLD